MRGIPASLTNLSVKVNALMGGQEGFSVCATLYHKKCNETLLGKAGVWIVDRLFFWDKQHCRKAYLLRNK